MAVPDPDRFKRIGALFTAARSLPADERAAFLSDECGDDAALRAEIDAMLAHDDQPHELLEQPLAARTPVAGTPTRIGAYTVLDVLGVGGMGIVYRAEQNNPRRLVALKVIQLGATDERLRRRFRRETQLLAALQHPGIAQIFEAGEADQGGVPQPYFAMEYVQGRSITAYADGTELGTRGRLRLILDVCAAVTHAHEQGIIHRDLKPGNVLVTDDGTVKVLDFGIARAVDADAQTTLRTDVDQLAGTIPYMSPEQLTGEPVGVPSDVYALGVLCYELLAGRVPLDLRSKPLPEAARIIREVDPTPLSAVNRIFRGDLDTILGKALEKDPGRRYPSVSELAADIERYLRDEPVSARPASSFYQLRKFARRNKAIVVGVVSVMAVLVAGMIVTLALLLQVSSQRDAKERQRHESDWNAYVANIAAAEAAIRSLHAGDAQQRLDLAPVTLRNWEWRHLNARADRSAQRVECHEPDRVVKAIVFTRDGETAYSCGDDGTVQEWRVADGACLRELRGHEVWVHDIALNPDETRLATASQDGTVKIWDSASGEVLDVLRDHTSGVRAVAWSPDGHWLATAARDQTLVVRDMTRGEIAHTLEIPPLPPDHGVQFSPDGGLLAAAGEWTVHLWETASFTSRQTLTCDTRPSTIEFDASGEHLFVGDAAGAISVWDTGSAMRVRRWEAHAAGVADLDFTPDGTRLVSASLDRSVRVWDARSDALLGTFVGHAARVTAVALSPGGALVASGDRDVIRIWLLATDDVMTLRGHDGRVRDLQFSADGTRLLTIAPLGDQLGGTRALEWDVATGAVARTIVEQPGGYNTAVAYVEGGAVAVSYHNAPAMVYADGAPPRAIGEAASAPWLVSSPDGGRLACSLPWTDEVVVYDAATGEERGRSAPLEGTARLAWSPDGATLAVVTEESVALLDSSTLAVTRVLDPAAEPRGDISGIAYSADGRLLAAGGQGRTAVVWDAASGTVLRTLRGHQGPVLAVGFSPDGTRLATGSSDGTIKLWDLPSGRDVATLYGHAGTVLALDFSPDGTRLASGSSDATVRVWAAD